MNYPALVFDQTLWQCRCIVSKTSTSSIHIMTHQSYIISSHHIVSPYKCIHVIIEDIALCIISTSSILLALHNTKWASRHLCVVITVQSVQWVLGMCQARCMLLSWSWGHCTLSQYNIITMVTVNRESIFIRF